MRLRQWVVLFGAMLVLGIARTSQQMAVRLKAYDVGRQAHAVHTLENETLWLNAQLMGLRSPARLAAAMRRDEPKLVAWSPLRSAASATRVARASKASADRLSD